VGLTGAGGGGVGDIETGVVRQQVKAIRGGKTRVSDGRLRWMREKDSEIANAKGIALRLREHVRRNYFSCTRSGVFMGKRGVPLRLLARDNRSGCGSHASVFLGARD
jgi:hypothetical protein